VPRLTFTPGEILTAANLNVVSDQTVMVFDDAAARTTAIPSPSEGMVTYLKDTDNLEKFDGTNFVNAAPQKILQVVSTSKTDTFSMSSATYADVTGMSATITPQSTSSKILILVHANISVADDNGNGVFLQVVGGNAGTYVGDASSSRVRAAAAVTDTQADFRVSRAVLSTVINFLDQPNTTSATTYKLQMRASSTNAVFLNRSGVDDNSTRGARVSSSFTVMEVAG